MTKLIIVRGLPGSGKSTFAKNNFSGCIHFEADMYFGDDYKFDKKLLPKAHEWCYENVKKNLEFGYDVIVSNTFTRLWELQKYFGLQDIIDDLEIIVYEMKTEYQNIHDVHESTIKRMKERWEELPDTYNVIKVKIK